MTHTYHNPWAGQNGPQDFKRDVEPIEHCDCQIFRVHQHQYDVVKAGVCISQRGGLQGAKLVAEAVSDLIFPTFHDVRARMLEKHGFI